MRKIFNEFVQDIHPELNGGSLESIEEGDLPNLLSEFFIVIAKEDGEEYNAATLEIIRD